MDLFGDVRGQAGTQWTVGWYRVVGAGTWVPGYGYLGSGIGHGTWVPGCGFALVFKCFLARM